MGQGESVSWAKFDESSKTEIVSNLKKYSEFKGPQGDQGPPGKDGKDGIDGAKGDQGPEGPMGPRWNDYTNDEKQNLTTYFGNDNNFKKGITEDSSLRTYVTDNLRDDASFRSNIGSILATDIPFKNNIGSVLAANSDFTNSIGTFLVTNTVFMGSVGSFIATIPTLANSLAAHATLANSLAAHDTMRNNVQRALANDQNFQNNIRNYAVSLQPDAYKANTVFCPDKSSLCTLPSGKQQIATPFSSKGFELGLQNLQGNFTPVLSYNSDNSTLQFNAGEEQNVMSIRPNGVECNKPALLRRGISFIGQLRDLSITNDSGAIKFNIDNKTVFVIDKNGGRNVS
jgi:hypothetical protein